MSRTLRRLYSTLGSAIVSLVCISSLPGDLSLAFNHQESCDSNQERRRHRNELTFTEIDFPDASITAVSDINDRGQIVGAYIDAGGAQHGFLLADGVFTTIDFKGGDINIARGINDRGQIVGTFFDAQGVTHSYLLDDGVFTLIDFPGESGTTVNGINKRGQIVGTFIDAEDLPHGILFDNGAFTTFEPPDSIFSVPARINDRGQIAGFFVDADAAAHGFLFDDGVFTRIDFPGAPLTATQGINNRGQIVGAFGETAEQPHGFLLDGGVFTQIDFPGAILTSLFAINNRSQIVGRFADAGAMQGSFLATKEQFNGKAIGVGAGEEKATVEIVGTFTSPIDLDLSAATLTISSLLNERAGAGELVRGLPLTLTAVPESHRDLAQFVDQSRPNPASVTILNAGAGKFIFRIKVDDAAINSPQQLAPIPLTTSFRLDAASKPPITVSTERSWIGFGPSNRFLKTLRAGSF